MKIGIDCREFYEGKVTGIGRYLGNFISYASRERSAWEFLLFGSQHTRIPFDFGQNVKAATLYEANTQFWEQVLLPLELKKRGCDLFYSPYHKAPFFSPAPAVVTIHDLTGLVYPGYRKGASWRRALSGLYAARAAAVITSSANSLNDIVNLLGVAREKISVCGGGVDAALFYPRKKDGGTEARHGIRRPYALYVGNSNPHKNLAGLLEAWALLERGLREKYSLVLAGVGDYRPPAALAASVIVIDRASDRDLPFLYSGAELFVFPSYYEGFGFPPLEAMACGCPVAASRASCLPEILGDAALYFDPARPEEIAAALSRALREPALRAGLSAKGLARAKLYTPAGTYSALIGVFETVMKAAVRGGGRGA